MDHVSAILDGVKVSDDEYERYAINIIAHCTNVDKWYDYHFDFAMYYGRI